MNGPLPRLERRHLTSTREGIVLSRTGGRYRVFTDGDLVDASLRGRLKQDKGDRVVVGDRVVLQARADRSATIESVCERRTMLRRRGAGKGRGERIVAANVDRVVVVGAVARPTWDPHLMDRFTAVAGANGLPVSMVVNKCDLSDACAECAAPYRSAGYSVILTSVPGRQGLQALREVLEDGVSVFTGPTGVGKSSLLNVLQPGLQLRTREVSEKSRGGRHTTVASEMHPFGQHGFVVDTPGLRDIALWGLGAADVAAAFPEIERDGVRCRFDNCRHLDEPGCAVVEAVGTGSIAASRLSSYRQMLREAHRAARPWA